MHIKISEKILSTTGMVVGLFVGSSILSVIKMVNDESTFLEEIPKVLAGALAAGVVIFLIRWIAKKLWGVRIIP